jgi:hypothetical protein
MPFRSAAPGRQRRDANQLRFHHLHQRAGAGHRPGRFHFVNQRLRPRRGGGQLDVLRRVYSESTRARRRCWPFLEAGACGSYGTVVEPCNYPYKFPDPMVYFYQNRGFCLAEAYYQSLANPTRA